MRINARIAPTGAYNDRRADWRMGEADDRRDFGARDGWGQPGVPTQNGFGDNFRRGGDDYGYGRRGGWGNQNPMPVPMPMPMPTPIDGGYNGGFNGGYNGGFNGGYGPGNPWQPMPVPTPIGYNNGGGFFSDLWNGFKNGLSSDVQDGLHPIQTIGNVLRNPGSVIAPYSTAIRWGHPGWALGRLVANVGVVGGLVLGGRALIGAFGGAAGAAGGAGVGVGGGASTGILSKVGGFFGSIVHGIGSAVSGVFHGIGSLFGGGGAAVGMN